MPLLGEPDDQARVRHGREPARRGGRDDGAEQHCSGNDDVDCGDNHGCGDDHDAGFDDGDERFGHGFQYRCSGTMGAVWWDWVDWRHGLCVGVYLYL